MPIGRSGFAFVPGAVNFQPAAEKFMAKPYTSAIGGGDLCETEILRPIPVLPGMQWE